MKDNQKYTVVGMIIVALIILFVAYKFFYSEDVAKAEKVQGEIDALVIRENELNEKSANRPMYESGIAASKDIIDTVLALYGPGNTPEKTIMLIVDLCKMTGVTIPNVSFQNDTLVYASETLNEKGDPELKIFQGRTNISISCGYTQFKKLTDYINSYPERMNAENFSITYDAGTGQLSVSMSVNLYAVTDDKHEYVAPVIEGIELGTDNIFKTYEPPVVDEEGELGTEGQENPSTQSISTTETSDNSEE